MVKFAPVRWWATFHDFHRDRIGLSANTDMRTEAYSINIDSRTAANGGTESAIFPGRPIAFRRALTRGAGWIRVRTKPTLGWVALIASCYLLSETGEYLRIPAAQLVVSMFVGGALALSGVARRRMPARVGRASQAIVGVLMGSYLAPSALGAITGRALPLVGVTVASIAICVAVAAVLTRRTRTNGVDTTLGLMPGGSAAIVAYAKDIGADSRFVAFAQYLRVGVVALSAPLIIVGLGGNPGSSHPGRFPSFSHLVASSHQATGLAMLTSTGLLGVWLARRLRLPAPALLGPMFLTAAILWTNLTGGFAPAGSLRDIAFVLVGLEVGLRFDLASVRHLRSMLPYLLAASVMVCLACAGLAWALAVLVGMPFIDSYLATTPGGINAVLATAASSHANLPVIAGVQSIRLLLVIGLTAPLIQAGNRWRALRARRTAMPVGSVTSSATRGMPSPRLHS